ncbi:TIR domain-containing protein [Gimesia chilikensis]|uniref:TIR domain-containing protein n=1 Tax=Gimesia chilikensis TaxID=2605989 RepID=UPI00118C2710|nr:nucleotide-binding protein [Gimesia chilikensis]QDT84602.1 putative nucleotide-binding protein containing TIR-like domain protein [Gimesia chilikensis]
MNDAITSELQKYVSEGQAALKDDVGCEMWKSKVLGFLRSSSDETVFSDFDHITREGSIYAIEEGISYLKGLIARHQSNLSCDSNEVQKNAEPNSNTQPIVGHVFIVHGHDSELKVTVARFLEHLKLTPIILHEKPNGGNTIIEKFECYSDVEFSIVLLTPDDVGAAKSEKSDLKKRARQNVIFEFGYFIGKLGRDRVCALYCDDIELPSDYDGVLYIKVDSEGAWKTKLAQEFVRANLHFSVEGLIGFSPK